MSGPSVIRREGANAGLFHFFLDPIVSFCSIGAVQVLMKEPKERKLNKVNAISMFPVPLYSSIGPGNHRK